MDTFIDKLAQKKNAQEMIKANMTAEAAKMEQLQNQMQANDGLMQEIRKVNLKTVENVSEMRKALEACIEKLDALQADSSQTEQEQETLAEIKNLLEEKFRQSEDFMHKENVKVYRNVQAPMVAESPVNLECRVTRKLELGTHHMFLAEVLAVHVDETYMDENGSFRLNAARPLVYSHGRYLGIGRELVTFGYSVRKKPKHTKNNDHKYTDRRRKTAGKR